MPQPNKHINLPQHWIEQIAYLCKNYGYESLFPKVLQHLRQENCMQYWNLSKLVFEAIDYIISHPNKYTEMRMYNKPENNQPNATQSNALVNSKTNIIPAKQKQPGYEFDVKSPLQYQFLTI